MSPLCPMLLELPTELLSRVLALLDQGSVVSLMDALPALKRDAVIVTDHNLPLVYFGDVQGVKRVYIDDGKRQPGDVYTLYKKYQDNYLIRLVELINRPSQMSFFLDEDISRPSVRLSQSTFMFARLCSHKDSVTTRDLARLISKSQSGTKVHVGAQVFYSGEENIDRYVSGVLQSGNFYPDHYPTVHGPHWTSFPQPGIPLIDGASFSSVITLTVNCKTSFSHCYFPNLKSLTLIFNTEPWRVPVVSYINAPFLTRFIVHYNNRVPLFYRMHDTSTAKQIDPEDNGLWTHVYPVSALPRERRKGAYHQYSTRLYDPWYNFELTHMGSALVHGDSTTTATSSSSPLCEFDQRCYKRTDLPFMKLFTPFRDGPDHPHAIGAQSKALLNYCEKRCVGIRRYTYWRYDHRRNALRQQMEAAA